VGVLRGGQLCRQFGHTLNFNVPLATRENITHNQKVAGGHSAGGVLSMFLLNVTLKTGFSHFVDG